MKTNPLPLWFPGRSLYRNWAASILVAAGVSSTDAATLFWDPAGGSPGAQGGSGNWLTSNGGNPWWNGSANTSWVDGSSATFGGGGSLVEAGGVTVDDITFDSSGYELQLGGSSGALTLGLGDGTHHIVCNADATISVKLNGTEGFTKSGSGTLKLFGNNNSSGGPIVINEGQIITAGSGLGDTSPVTIASGASLTINGSEAIGGLSGAGTVSLMFQPTFTAGDSSDTTFSGTITGASGMFQKVGSGTLTLSGKIVSNLVTQISGGTLAMSNTDGTRNGSFAISSTATLRLLAAQRLGGILGSGTIDLGSYTLTVDASSPDFSGAIVGSGGFTFNPGAGGQMTLTHAITYTGPTAIESGKLIFISGGVLSPSSAVTIQSGAELSLNDNAQAIGELNGDGTVFIVDAPSLTIGANNTSTTFSGVITSSSIGPAYPVTKVGTGTLTLSGVNTYTGLTTISGGTLALSGGNALPNNKAVTISPAGTLRLLTAETLGGINGGGAVILDAGAILSIPNLAGYTGTISGAGGLTMTGTGTSTLSGTHTFSGGLTITLGSVSVAQPGNTATGGPLGRGLVTLGTAGSNSSLTVTTTGAVSSDLPLAVEGVGTITKSGAGTLTLSGPISGNAALRISGNILLSGAMSSFAGGTIVSAGKLQVSGGQALPDTGTLSFFTGTTFELLSGSDETVGSLDGEATVILGGQRLTSGGDGTSTQFSGVISGTGGSQMEKRGNSTLTLTNPNSSFSGGVLISEGVISVPTIGNVGSNSPLGSDGTITLGDTSHSGGLRVTGMGMYSTDRPFNVSAGGGSIDFGGNELSLSGALTGSGTLTKLGSGRLRLTGSSSYSGEVALTQGALRIEGQLAAASFSVASGTTLDTVNGTSPGIGRLTLAGGRVEVGGAGAAGSLATGDVLFSSGTLSIDLKDGTTPGYDHLDVTGGITFDGTITLALQLDYDPEDHVDVIRIISNDGTDPTSLLSPEARFFYDGRMLEEGQIFVVTSGAFSQLFQMHYGLDGADNDVRLVAAPEPGIAGLLGLGACLGLARRQRKFRATNPKVDEYSRPAAPDAAPDVKGV